MHDHAFAKNVLACNSPASFFLASNAAKKQINQSKSQEQDQ
jgi:hypothetical protein